MNFISFYFSIILVTLLAANLNGCDCLARLINSYLIGPLNSRTHRIDRLVIILITLKYLCFGLDLLFLNLLLQEVGSD
jgi:hypothetical protein